MSAGGKIIVQWAGKGSCSITVTGPGTINVAGGGAASFPHIVTTDQGYDILSDGPYVVTVKVLGRTVASATAGIANGSILVFSATPDLDDLYALLSPVASTTAALAAIGNVINTADKYAGKMVFNATTSKPVWAVDGTAGGVWLDHAAGTAHTPV